MIDQDKIDAVDAKRDIPFQLGVTGFSNLLKIGLLSAGRKYDPEMEGFRTPVDDAVLRQMENAVHQALIVTTASHTAIGALMAYCEIREIAENAMADLGFLICGLGELNEQLIQEALQISDERLQRYEASKKSP